MNKLLMRKLAAKLLRESMELADASKAFQTPIGDSYMTASIVLTHLAKAIMNTEEEI